MNLLIVSASQRSESQSVKVGHYIEQVVSSAGQFAQVEHVELCQINLPLFNGDFAGLKAEDSAWLPLQQKLEAADAYVFVTPEWSGQASPMLKNMLLICNQKYTGHKPAMLVSVVAGVNGAYPIAELRMNGFKNNKIVPIPDHVIVRDAESMLNAVEEGEEMASRDKTIRDRIEFSLLSLHQYAVGLSQVRTMKRDNPFPKQSRFASGM